MLAKYDTETIELTEDFVSALKVLMAAECRMMQQNEPELADCWTWGRAYVEDLAKASGITFEFGGDDCLPDDGLGRFGVL